MANSKTYARSIHEGWDETVTVRVSEAVPTTPRHCLEAVRVLMGEDKKPSLASHTRSSDDTVTAIMNRSLIRNPGPAIPTLLMCANSISSGNLFPHSRTAHTHPTAHTLACPSPATQLVTFYVHTK